MDIRTKFKFACYKDVDRVSSGVPKNSRRNSQKRYDNLLLAKLLIITLFGVCTSQNSLANPSGGQVVSGSASINTSTENPKLLNITQTTDKAIINWQSFSIAADEQTQFIQPSSSSIILNRVIGSDPSKIFGQLSANGQVVLINPAGIYISPNARININSLILTTANISDKNFLEGNYHFVQTPGTATSVINEGEIHAAAQGLVALVAPGVANTGIIKASLGKVILASGNEFTIDLYGDNLINFVVENKVTTKPTDITGKPLNDAVANSGKIFADGGKVLLTANAAQNVVQNTINMSGIVQADTVYSHKGTIVLASGDTGSTTVSGALNARGKDANTNGGTIKILGKRVQLTETARVDTSGQQGGEILVGGNKQGLGPEPNAVTTSVAKGAFLNASALDNGDGGKIIIWSDQDTEFFGRLAATGGTFGGNGGFAEVSGKSYLNFQGTVDLTAPLGKIGSLLLDPRDIIITTENDSQYFTNFYTPNAATSIINADTLMNALNYADVIIQTSTNLGNDGTQPGDITVNAPLIWSNHDLTLLANRDININQNIIIYGNGGNLILHANSAGLKNGGTVTIANGYTITLLTPNNSTVSIFYTPTSYIEPTDYSSSVQGGNVIAYMLVNDADDLGMIDYNSLTRDGTYALGRDITLSTPFNPISTFTGRFNGNFHTITNLQIDTSSSDIETGLFGIAQHAIIENVGLINATVHGGTGATGALVGLSSIGSIINNVYSEGGTVTASSSPLINPIGGLVGNNLGQINQSYTTGIVSTSNNGYIGGLVGQNQGSIANSYSHSTVSNPSSSFSKTGGLVGINESNGSIIHSYSTGNVNAPGSAGGLVGANNGAINNSFWDTETSGISTGIYGTGKTTSELKDAATFANANWDMSIWGIKAPDGQDYPYLQSLVQAFKGQAFDSNNQPISSPTSITLLVNGSQQFTTPTIGATGYYNFVFRRGTIPDNSLILAYLSGSTVQGTTVMLANSNHYNDLNIYGSQTTVRSDQLGFALSNTQLINAKGTASTNDILYAGSPGALSIDGKFATTLGTTYLLDGNITNSDNSPISFGGKVILVSDANITSNGGNINFDNINDSTAGSHGLTVISDGTINFNQTVGDVAAIKDLKVVDNTGWINISSNMTGQDGSFQFDGRVNLANYFINIGAASDHNLNLIFQTVGTSDSNLNLTAGNGDIYVNGPFYLNALTINSADTLYLNDQIYISSIDNLSGHNVNTVKVNISNPDGLGLIQQGLAFVKNQGTIEVGAGLYDEDVNIDNDINLIGPQFGAATVNSFSNSSNFSLSGNWETSREETSFSLINGGNTPNNDFNLNNTITLLDSTYLHALDDTNINLYGDIVGYQDLTLASDSGTVTLLGKLGSTASPLHSLTIQNTGQTQFGNENSVNTAEINVKTGDIDILNPVTLMNLGAQLTTSNGGTIIYEDGTVGGGNINFNGTVNGYNNLTLAAPNANITFFNDVGTTTPLAITRINDVQNFTEKGKFKTDTFIQANGSGTSDFGMTTDLSANFIQIITNYITGWIQGGTAFLTANLDFGLPGGGGIPQVNVLALWVGGLHGGNLEGTINNQGGPLAASFAHLLAPYNPLIQFKFYGEIIGKPTLEGTIDKSTPLIKFNINALLPDTDSTSTFPSDYILSFTPNQIANITTVYIEGDPLEPDTATELCQ